jgi:putative membrane protein
MIRILLQIALNGVGVLIAAYVVPGINYTGSWPYLLLVGLVIGLINLLVRPLVTLLSLPALILTLGLFYLLINGALFYLAAWALQGLTVDGCLPAVLGGLVLAIFNWLTRGLVKKNKKRS